jgi:ParB family chromosome partitioning protein
MVEADRRRLLQACFQGRDSGSRGRVCTGSVTRLAKLKKADIASEAERLADGTGWMPAIFKAAGPQEVTPEDVPEDGAEDAAAVADEPAEALAA